MDTKSPLSIVPLGLIQREHGVPGRGSLYSYRADLYGVGATQWAHQKNIFLSTQSLSSSENLQNWTPLQLQEVKALSSTLDKAQSIVLSFDAPLEKFSKVEFGVNRADFLPLEESAKDLYLCDIVGAEVWNLSKEKRFGKVVGTYCLSKDLPQAPHNLVIQGERGLFECPLAWVDLDHSLIRPFGSGISVLEIPQIEDWVDLKD